MSTKALKNITLAEAMTIARANGMKMDFNTRDADIKAFARKILKEQKKNQS